MLSAQIILRLMDHARARSFFAFRLEGSFLIYSADRVHISGSVIWKKNYAASLPLDALYAKRCEERSQLFSGFFEVNKIPEASLSFTYCERLASGGEQLLKLK